jgi:hypothetical protein
MGAVPGTDIDESAMCALLDRDLITSRTVLANLVQARLLEMIVAARYQMHDLLREYAVELLRDGLGEVTSGRVRLATLYGAKPDSGGLI